MVKRKLYATIVGYGNRGQVYADYALECPDEFGIAARIQIMRSKRKIRTAGRQIVRGF